MTSTPRRSSPPLRSPDQRRGDPEQSDTPQGEDGKIILLAASARARTGSRQGACVRDSDGRTYAACSIDLPDLQLSGVQLAVAMAVSSGAAGLEAVALAGERETDADLALLRERRCPTLWRADDRGRGATPVTL